MASLNKSENGLIFYDNFKDPTLLWTLSPSDANNLRFGDNGLTMLHHRRYTTFTMTEPSLQEYSCIVELDHIPRNFDDIAGVIIIANNKEYAECQSFLATGPSELGNSNLIQADINKMIQVLLDDSYVRYTIDSDTLDENGGSISIGGDSEESSETEGSIDIPFVDTFYRFIKFTKQKYKYIFWASEDGSTWIEVGNVSFESAGVIGFFIYGTTDEDIINNSHFNVKSMAIYNSRYLTIDAISREYDFELIDGDGTVLMRTDNLAYFHIFNRSNNRCLINTATLPMPIRNATIRLYPKKDYQNTIDLFHLGEETYGGDVYTLEHNIKAYIHNTEVSPTEIFDLGAFARGSYHILLVIRNCEDYRITDVKLRVAAYSEYYSGSEEVELALPKGDISETALKYHKTLTIDAIEANAEVSVYIKLTDKMLDMFYHAASIYRFKITIE